MAEPEAAAYAPPQCSLERGSLPQPGWPRALWADLCVSRATRARAPVGAPPSKSPICFGRYRQPHRSIGQEKFRAWCLEKAAGQEVEGTSLVVLSLSFAQAVQYALGGFSVLAVIGWVLISSEHHATSGKRKCGNVCPSRSWPLTKPGPRSFLEDVDRDGRELIWEDGASILEECKTPGKTPAWGDCSP